MGRLWEVNLGRTSQLDNDWSLQERRQGKRRHGGFNGEVLSDGVIGKKGVGNEVDEGDGMMAP